MSSNVTRRRFLSGTAASVALPPLLAGCSKRGGETPQTETPGSQTETGPKSVGKIRLPGKPAEVDLAVAENTDFGQATEDALNAFGGLAHFVKQGDNVILSPNIAFARDPEIGANTHPDVLRKVIQLCEAAGAASITVMDYTLDQKAVAFEVSGANQAVNGTSAKLVSPDSEELYSEVKELATLKGHKMLGLTQKVPKALLRADVLISMPVAKDHEAARVSFSMKKSMGLVWERQGYHRQLHQCIADLNSVLRPSLIVLDATRSLQDRGPKGPGEVTTPNQVVVGVDPVAVDTYACRYLTLKGTKPEDVPHLKLAQDYGIGTMDLTSLTLKEAVA